jgi:hypothetical protein
MIINKISIQIGVSVDCSPDVVRMLIYLVGPVYAGITVY